MWIKKERRLQREMSGHLASKYQKGEQSKQTPLGGTIILFAQFTSEWLISISEGHQIQRPITNHSQF